VQAVVQPVFNVKEFHMRQPAVLSTDDMRFGLFAVDLDLGAVFRPQLDLLRRIE
jgi:hypothetical protein